MTRDNCRAVLAAGCLLGGMEDLCHFAYEMCRDSISLETIDEWLDFVQHVSPGDGTASPSVVPVQHHYAPRLRTDVFNFLVELPTTLEVQTPGGNGREMLLQVFTRIPFEFFKGAIESPTFQIGECITTPVIRLSTPVFNIEMFDRNALLESRPRPYYGSQGQIKNGSGLRKRRLK